jgi:hypothetical protein
MFISSLILGSPYLKDSLISCSHYLRVRSNRMDRIEYRIFDQKKYSRILFEKPSNTFEITNLLLNLENLGKFTLILLPRALKFA